MTPPGFEREWRFSMRKPAVVVGLCVVVVLALAAVASSRPTAQEITTRAAIDAAYERGAIGYDEMILQKAYAIYAPDKLTLEFRADTIDKSGTPLVDEIDRALPDLPQEVADEIRGLRARPVCTDYIDTAHFRIHYNTSGTHRILGWPDTTYRDAIAVSAELSWTEEVTNLGFRPPPNDGGDPDGGGGSNHYDIYVQALSGVYGYCQGSYTVPGTPQTDCTSYVVIDNDYVGFGYPDPQDPMKVTVAHEFCHACQNAHDYSEDVWYKECTSVWVEEVIYDEIDDYRQYLPFIFNSLYRSLDYEDPTGLRIYGSCIWNIYLAEKFGNQIIPEIWYALEGSAGVFNIIGGVLTASYGSTIEDEITDFYIWNFFTGARDDGQHYDEGSTWPSTAFVRIYSTYPVVDGAPYEAHRPDHMGANYVKLNYPGSGYDLLHLAYDGPNPSTVPSSAYIVYEDTGGDTYEYGGISLNFLGNGSIDISGWNAMSYASLIVVNATDNINDLDYTFDADEDYGGVSGETYSFGMKPASPNPFTETTSIAYTVPTEGGFVEITIYDVSGREIRRLLTGEMPGGHGVALWDGLDNEGDRVASGVYFARLDVDGLTAMGKLMVLK
jgi:hypothetical protein